jgi:hypothetical protein
MSDYRARTIFEEIVASLDVPESAYEKAQARYKDLGAWFDDPESHCFKYAPHIYPQGSFRLGIVNRPFTEDWSFDLDLGCRLESGISKASHSQRDLKRLVGLDLQSYRKARQIEGNLEEKHRCWRLPYKDQLSFHMDAVPSIPQDTAVRLSLKSAMVKAGSTEALAGHVAEYAGAITDNRSPDYTLISNRWRISNSEGYALWFESRIKLAQRIMEERALSAMVAKVDDLPTRKWKSPLQQAVQMIKRHRDVMFIDDPDGMPISIILTTLAASAYGGETDVASALDHILKGMSSCVRTTIPRVPNPVNPVEDFADKWRNPNYRHLNLEQNFWIWLTQAQEDFRAVAQARDSEDLAQLVKAKFAISVDKKRIEERLGWASSSVVRRPKVHSIEQTPAKPWMHV